MGKINSFLIEEIYFYSKKIFSKKQFKKKKNSTITFILLLLSWISIIDVLSHFQSLQYIYYLVFFAQ